MSETHINSYAGDLEAAKVKVVQALGEFEAKQEALKSHPDYDEKMLVELPFKVVYPTAPKAEPTKAEAKA